jgi:hypothetical protein
MPRTDVILDEMAQPLHGSRAHMGTAWNPSGAEPRSHRFAPPKPARKRPGCKSCDGRKCVGTCRF